WATIGEGREFSLLLDQPGFEPVRYSSGYARAIAFQHRLGSQDVLEVWDLGERKKVGALKGKNEFRGEIALSPTGKYVAGRVRDGSGGWRDSLQVWAMAQGQRVCEIPPPSEDHDVDILDYANDETLLGIYRHADTYRLRLWNIADGSTKLQINLGE